MLNSVIAEIHKVLEGDIRPKMHKCNELLGKTDNQSTKKQLGEKYELLNAMADRCSVCIEILNGEAFTFKDEVAGLTIVLPKDAVRARYVVEAEKLGARVTGHGDKE